MGTDARPGPTALPQSTVIAVASSASLLVLLSVALLISITSCFVALKREKNKQLKPHPNFQHQQNSVLLDYNPAYNDRHPAGSDSQHQYQEQQPIEPYYSLVTQEEDDTTSGTRDSYVEIQPSYNINNSK